MSEQNSDTQVKDEKDVEAYMDQTIGWLFTPKDLEREFLKEDETKTKALGSIKWRMTTSERVLFATRNQYNRAIFYAHEGVVKVIPVNVAKGGDGNLKLTVKTDEHFQEDYLEAVENSKRDIKKINDAKGETNRKFVKQSAMTVLLRTCGWDKDQNPTPEEFEAMVQSNLEVDEKTEEKQVNIARKYHVNHWKSYSSYLKEKQRIDNGPEFLPE